MGLRLVIEELGGGMLTLAMGSGLIGIFWNLLVMVSSF